MKLLHTINYSDDSIIVRLDAILAGTILHKLEKKPNEEWPVKFYTATHQMNDFIGNIVESDENSCSVRGVYNGYMQVVRNVKIGIDCHMAKKGERVMVTEHLNVDGKLEFLATKSRILIGDLNFINIGWSNGNKCRFQRIDVYTGESKIIVGPPCFAFLTEV
jgi:hypothetical protein